MIVAFIVGGLLLVCALLIAFGRGDWLIAGYNTASKEEKSKVNIKRLRWLTAYVCTAAATVVFIDCYVGLPRMAFTIILFFGIVLPTAILANTWAKEKKR